MRTLKACLFDLDGVIVDTARYHFLAWKQLAEQLGIDFTEEHNELLKGVSRMRSLDIILEIGGKTLSEEEKTALANKKNEVYLEYILKMDESEILPGVKSFITELKNNHIRVALGSASKNARLILKRLNIENLFDAVIDGNKVSEAKPDPEVFLNGAAELQVEPEACVVFEDAVAGIEAAQNAGMFCVGIGDITILKKANLVIPGFADFNLEKLQACMQEDSYLHVK
ncbi:beta-phosphoglucomutase [Gaoshiqia sediminis]|uniref:Beta-phosphoglucomutase n=1 Tax=Gaoshiqia sediminis TaxID=2986998 RepID=A0AA42C486_9BACT|nr:beta-phosphoglucomutase [Gaoshiqia sediminis]MCW0481518.1 beta-phosphoglucomutase [Gaoshiqia sediminis]